MEFDSEREGTGTHEWAEVTENICRGCQNNCLYCYAAHNANRFNLRPRSEWGREELTKRANITSYPAKNGVVMFPSSHDITPFNLLEYIRVAKLILEKGNRLLIVSKPRIECVALMVKEFDPWRDQILFRFTIGSIYKHICDFWEPGAPSPCERIECLKLAQVFGYKTSVSIEPMLEGALGANLVIGAVRELVTDTIWIGKMNKIRLRVDLDEPGNKEAVDSISELQNDQAVIDLYQSRKGDPMIRWKDSIKEVISRCGGIQE